MKKHLRFYCILLTCMLCSISAKAEFDTRVRYGIGNLYYYLDFSSKPLSRTKILIQAL